MKSENVLQFLNILVLFLLLTGCGTSPKINFYMLNAPSEFKPVKEDNVKREVIAVWAVRLPDYLDRSEIVVRSSPYEVVVSDFSWWAGDLRQNITNLLANELGQRLQTNKIIATTWGDRCKKDFQIKTYVDRFDGELGGNVIFKGVWVLLDGEGRNELVRENFNFKTTIDDESYEELVAALSKLTVKLSAQMAYSIISYKK